MSAELDDRQQPFDDDQFWEKPATLFFRLEGKHRSDYGMGRVLRDPFQASGSVSVTPGQPHWDGLLGLVQSVLTLTELQPQKTHLDFYFPELEDYQCFARNCSSSSSEWDVWPGRRRSTGFHLCP